jgi:hypothetical protein
MVILAGFWYTLGNIFSLNGLESLSPQSVPLPKQTEEEINSLINYLEVEEINSLINYLEVEDIMEDAINNLGMFSEKD